VTTSPPSILPGLGPAVPAAQLIEDLTALRGRDVPHEGGRLFAYVFEHGDPDLSRLQLQAYAAFSAVNMLDPTAFPSVVALENDVVGAVLDVFSAPAGAVGTFTSGGTESCMLAVKAARDVARPGSSPSGRRRVVLPESAHQAFAKAAAWLDLDVVRVPVEPDGLTADVQATLRALDPSTCLVVASAVSYPHGVLDPVAELADACAGRGIPLHVDACIGGLVLAGRRALGEDVPPFDFAVPGVTSLSVDLHKYGYALKPASVVLFRERALRRASWFGYGSWAGYPLVNSTVQSTKSAGPLAAAWVTLRALGAEGYLRAFAAQLEATRRIVRAVEQDPRLGLRVLGRPAASLVALGSDVLDVGALADAMRARGWHLQTQLSYGSAPASLHLTVDAATAGTVDEMLDDLAACCAQVRAQEVARVPDALAAVLGSLTVDQVTPETLAGLLSGAGLDGGAAGEIVLDARVSAMLQALAPEVRGAVALLVADGIFTPTRADGAH
jgi:glutamate/tyrosine decarboxylase-like PLP-dependent enzyme